MNADGAYAIIEEVLQEIERIDGGARLDKLADKLEEVLTWLEQM